MEDCLIIGFDKSEKEDITGLAVGRPGPKKTYIINMFYGKKAEKIYKILTGELRFKKQYFRRN